MSVGIALLIGEYDEGLDDGTNDFNEEIIVGLWVNLIDGDKVLSTLGL